MNGKKIKDPEAYSVKEEITDKPPPIILRPGFIQRPEVTPPTALITPVTIPEVSDFEMNFGTDKFYRAASSLPEKFREGGLWAEFLEGLLMGTLDKNIQLYGRPGVRPDQAWRVLVATLNAKGILATEKLANGAFICHTYFRSIGYMRTDETPRAFRTLMSEEAPETPSV